MRGGCLRGWLGCWWRFFWGWRSFGLGFFLFIGICGIRDDASKCRSGILRSRVSRCWRWGLFGKGNDAFCLGLGSGLRGLFLGVSCRRNLRRIFCDLGPRAQSTSFSFSGWSTWVRACRKRSNSWPFGIGWIFQPWPRFCLRSILGWKFGLDPVVGSFCGRLTIFGF